MILQSPWLSNGGSEGKALLRKVTRCSQTAWLVLCVPLCNPPAYMPIRIVLKSLGAYLVLGEGKRKQRKK